MNSPFTSIAPWAVAKSNEPRFPIEICVCSTERGGSLSTHSGGPNITALLLLCPFGRAKFTKSVHEHKRAQQSKAERQLRSLHRPRRGGEDCGVAVHPGQTPLRAPQHQLHRLAGTPFRSELPGGTGGWEGHTKDLTEALQAQARKQPPAGWAWNHQAAKTATMFLFFPI